MLTRIFNFFRIGIKLYKLNRKEYITIPKSCIIDKNIIIKVCHHSSFVCKEKVRLSSAFQGAGHVGISFSCCILADGEGANINIGKKSRLNSCFIHAQKRISIGELVLIAPGVNIIDSNGHELISTDRTTIGTDKPQPIEIGNNVWIGLNAVILKGTIIGDNSVVGANSVVKGEYPANSLIMGNPAKVVKTLNIVKESNK